LASALRALPYSAISFSAWDRARRAAPSFPSMSSIVCLIGDSLMSNLNPGLHGLNQMSTDEAKRSVENGGWLRSRAIFPNHNEGAPGPSPLGTGDEIVGPGKPVRRLSNNKPSQSRVHPSPCQPPPSPKPLTVSRLSLRRISPHSATIKLGILMRNQLTTPIRKKKAISRLYNCKHTQTEQNQQLPAFPSTKLQAQYASTAPQASHDHPLSAGPHSRTGAVRQYDRRKLHILRSLEKAPHGRADPIWR
jgi:hypothetical protein